MTTFGDRVFQLGGQPVGGDLLSLLGVGNVRYIDPNSGSDGNTGKTPDRAWKTLQYAADQSGYSQSNGDSTGKHDILLRMPGPIAITSGTCRRNSRARTGTRRTGTGGGLNSTNGEGLMAHKNIKKAGIGKPLKRSQAGSNGKVPKTPSAKRA